MPKRTSGIMMSEEMIYETAIGIPKNKVNAWDITDPSKAKKMKVKDA
jgi:hypothetical protein